MVASGALKPERLLEKKIDIGGVNELRHLATDTDSIAAWRGSDIYFARGGGQTTWPGPVLFRIPSAGGPEERLFDAPAGCAEALRLGPDARTVVCALDESRLDIRLVDGLRGG